MESATAERLPSNSLPPIGIEIEDSLEQLGLDSSNLSPYHQGEGADQASPKPRNNRDQKEARDKRPVKLIHHANKGKQQRDRRKLREKRRSTGVVHLASTESTGGSTTGDDELDNGGDILGLCSETRRNTQQNETSIAGSPAAADTVAAEAAAAAAGERKNSGHHHKIHSPLYTGQGQAKGRLRGKSPRSEDLEADDEQGDKTDNDHDSLNLSESSSAVSVIAPPVVVTTGAQAKTGAVSVVTTVSVGLLSCDLGNSSTSTPIQRPTTPTTGEQGEDTMRLLDQLEEKDRRIQILELKVEQLSQDTRMMADEQARLLKENETLLRAINNLKK